MSTNLATALTRWVELSSPASLDVPTEGELETLDEAIASIDSELSAASYLALELRDRRERLLSQRAEIVLSRERAGLFAAGELVRFFDLEHVGPVEGNKGQ